MPHFLPLEGARPLNRMGAALLAALFAPAILFYPPPSHEQ